MTRTCRTCGAAYDLSREDLHLYELFGHEPAPECFTCIQKHHLSFRNGRNLYTRICDATGQKIISAYAPEKPFKVYERSYWYGDQWDPFLYGQDIDWNRPFFDQFRTLHATVPRIALHNVNSVNSEYCNMAIGNKNSYLVFGGDFNDGALYGTLNMRNRDVVDCDYSNENERSYWLFNSFKCYGCQFTFDSKNCNHCAFVSDCIGCSDCILCTNLRNKTFCIENQQLTKEEYLKRKERLLSGSFSQQQENLRQFKELRDQRIVKQSHMINCERCSGDYLENAKNCQNCFFTWNSEDTNNVFLGDTVKTCFQSTFLGQGSEFCYHYACSVNTHSCSFSYFLVDTYGGEYSEACIGCKNVFGCNGLRHKEYCILNKQYTKEEYEELVPRVIAHMRSTEEWGEFLPKDLSCYGYNESTVFEYWPLKREEALRQGFQWRDAPEEQPEVSRVIPASGLPDRIEDVPDDVLHWAIRCAASGKPFRIIKQELDFYRQQRIPLPRHHPNERYAQRMQWSNPFQLTLRPCGKCGKEMQTTYAPERPEIVYCENCYLKEVY